MKHNLQPIVAISQQLKRAAVLDRLRRMSEKKDRTRREFAKRLNDALTASGIPDDRSRRSKVAKRFNVSVESARKWLVGEVIPDTARLSAMAAELNCSVERLLTGKNLSFSRLNQPITISTNEIAPGYIRFPLLAVEASAGGGTVVDDYTETVAYVDVAESWARINLRANPEHIQVITARGDSMAGDISHGDVLFVDTSVHHMDSAGVFVLMWQGRALVKRLQPLMDGRLAIRSTNDAYETEYVTAKQADELHISGRVLAAWTLRRF